MKKLFIEEIFQNVFTINNLLIVSVVLLHDIKACLSIRINAFMKSSFKKVYFKFCLWNPRTASTSTCVLLIFERGVGNIPLYWEKINDPQWSLRRAGNVSSWKKVSIVFLPIRFLSFGARREGIYQDVFLPPRDYRILYDCLWENIRHCSLVAFGKREALPQINLLHNKNETLIEIQRYLVRRMQCHL